MQLSYRNYKRLVKQRINGDEDAMKSFVLEEEAVKQHLGIDDDEIVTYGCTNGDEPLTITTKYAVINNEDSVWYLRDGVLVIIFYLGRLPDGANRVTTNEAMNGIDLSQLYEETLPVAG